VESHIPGEILLSKEMKAGQRTLVVALKENAHGRFLALCEKPGAGHQTVVIPAEGFEDFQRILADMVDAAGKIPYDGCDGVEFPNGNR
jgi:hypothetical protein